MNIINKNKEESDYILKDGYFIRKGKDNKISIIDNIMDFILIGFILFLLIILPLIAIPIAII